MKVYTYSQARQQFARVLNTARHQTVLVRRRGGEVFQISPHRTGASPLDVKPVRTKATTRDILSAIHAGRSRVTNIRHLISK
ncbi:MAG: prevent-host-death protein [Phycisphaerae bacterium]